MKRALLFLLLLPIAACASTGLAGADGASTWPVAVGSPADRFQTGHALFSARCQTCHALPEPARLQPEAWPGEVVGMSRKAGLSADQVALISDYLVAASRSPQRTN